MIINDFNIEKKNIFLEKLTFLHVKLVFTHFSSLRSLPLMSTLKFCFLNDECCLHQEQVLQKRYFQTSYEKNAVHKYTTEMEIARRSLHKEVP